MENRILNGNQLFGPHKDSRTNVSACVRECVCVCVCLCTLPFKSLGSLRNVLVFERKAIFLSIKITSN